MSDNNNFIPSFGFMVKRGKIIKYDRIPSYKKTNLKTSLTKWVNKLIG